MFIARQDFLDKYCAWLFPILFEVERRTNFGNSSEDGTRPIGKICETLLNVYVCHNKIKTLYKPIYVLVDRKPKFYITMLQRLSWLVKTFFYHIYIRPCYILSEVSAEINQPQDY